MRLCVLYAEGLNDNHKYQEETDTHVVYTSKFNSQKKKNPVGGELGYAI